MVRLAPPAPLGVIAADCVYTLAAVKDRLDVGDAWLRQAQAKGLPVRRCGGRGFIVGSELIEFLAQEDRDAKR